MVNMDKESRKRSAIKKELDRIQRKEMKLGKAAEHNGTSGLIKCLEEKIPPTIHSALEKTFCKAFSIIFEKGTDIIEKSYDKESLREDYEIQNYAVGIKGTRRELRRMEKMAQMKELGNIAVTTAEGIVLGAFGIGLPDIVIFTGMLLKGIYETALRYGIDYCTSGERLLILKMMEAAVSKGEEWSRLNALTDDYMESGFEAECSDSEIMIQIEQTSKAFAVDMLLLKFIQGIPVAGILGGMGNPVYYHKIMQYVGIKYQKRYLQDLASRDAPNSKKLKF